MDTLRLINPIIDFGFGKLSSEVEAKNPTYTFTKKYNRSDYELGKNTVEEMGKYSFSSIFNEPYNGEGRCDFQIDIKMDGNINADFIINHADIDYTEKEIFLGEGNWDSADDRVISLGAKPRKIDKIIRLFVTKFPFEKSFDESKF